MLGCCQVRLPPLKALELEQVGLVLPLAQVALELVVGN
jgi:hypothetical protein